jgi:hypothetical protein
MYTLVKAVCLARTSGAQWKTVELADKLVFDIYNQYQEIYLELANVYLDDNVYVNFTMLRDRFSSYKNTLAELLADLGNNSLPTVESIPDASIKYVKYSDAIRVGYKVYPTIINQQLPANYPVADMTDLIISRPDYDTDLRLLHSHCLVSVNGYIHMTDASQNGEYGYVRDGCKSMLISSVNHLGIMSFLDVGRLTKIPITMNNIHPATDEYPLKKRIYLHVEQDTTNKTAILVLGGHLVFLEQDVFWQSGENTYAINPDSIPLLDRYFEAKRYLDLSSLGLTESDNNPDLISSDEFYTNEVLTKYLTLSQSFLVLVDVPHLFTNKIFLKHCSLPGIFTSYTEPVYPFIVNDGKMVEYWKTYEDGYWSVNIIDGYYRNYVYTHKSSKHLDNVTNQRVPMHTHYHTRGYLLEIGAYT